MNKKTVFIWCLLLFAVNIAGQNADINILAKINKIDETRGLSQFVSNSEVYVEIGLPAVLSGVALLCKNDDMLKNSISIFSSTCATVVATYAIKSVVRRPRPRVTYPDRIVWYEDISTNSFPSGHTAAAFSTATSVALAYPKWYIIVPSYLWAGYVGYSRMNLGVHYPSDVVCGAILGSGLAIVTDKLNKLLWKSMGNKPLIGARTAELTWY